MLGFYRIVPRQPSSWDTQDYDYWGLWLMA